MLPPREQKAKISIGWSQIVTTMIISGIGGAFIMYAAQARTDERLQNLDTRVSKLEEILPIINTRLSHIEGAVGAKKWSE